MVASGYASPAEKAFSNFDPTTTSAAPPRLGYLVLTALVAFAWAAYNAWLLPAAENDYVMGQATPSFVISLAAFVLSLIAFCSGATSKSRFYPLVAFGLIQQAPHSLFALVFSVMVMQNVVPFNYYWGVLAVHAAFGALSGVVLLIAALFAAGRSTAAGVVRVEAPATTRLRGRVRAYFQGKPIWPWLFIVAAIVFPIQMLNLGTQSYSFWNIAIETVFLFALYRLLSDDGRTVRFLDAPLFLVALRTLDTGQDTLNMGFIYQTMEPDYYWSTYWASYLNTYYIIVCAAIAVYALAYRFLIFPFFRRASDREIDALIDSQMRPIAEHGLARLGVDRSRLIAEPVVLRGLPDKENLNGAFIGHQIGRDDVLRFTPQRSTVMAFGDDQVLFYEGTVDLTTGHLIHESVVEFFYQDISNVARANGAQSVPLSRALSLKDRFFSLFSKRKADRCDRILNLTTGETLQYEGRDIFQINLESGRALAVILKDESFFDTSKKRFVSMFKHLRPTAALSVSQATSLAKTDLPEEENERVMRAVRLLIRDKKRSLLHQRI